MKRILQRTHQTSLLDDELLLLDVMFLTSACFGNLRQRGFKEQWNQRSHQMSDLELMDCLNSLVGRGILKKSLPESLPEDDRRKNWGEPCYEITVSGGEAWQSERKADWSRYATESYDETPSGKPTVTIIATTEETRENFWNVGCETRFWAYSKGAVKRAMITNTTRCQPLSWLRFPRLYITVAVLDDWFSGASHSDGEAFEERREFWRVVSELMKFW